MLDPEEHNEFDTVGNVILIFGLFSVIPGMIYYYYATTHFPGGKILHGALAIIGGFGLGYAMAAVKFLRMAAGAVLFIFFAFGRNW